MPIGKAVELDHPQRKPKVLYTQRTLLVYRNIFLIKTKNQTTSAKESLMETEHIHCLPGSREC